MPNQVDDLRATLETYLTEANVPFRSRGDRLSVRRGSSAVFVRPAKFADTHVIVELLCPLVSELAVSPPLLEWLNDVNKGLYFGKAYWHDFGVWIAHNLLGDHLDRAELLAAVGLLGTVADKLDDDVVEAFGGTRWIDTE